MSSTNGFRLELRSASEDETSTDEPDFAKTSNKYEERSRRSQGRTIALGGSTFDSLALDVSYSPSAINCGASSSSRHLKASPSLSRKLSNIWEIPDIEEQFADEARSSIRRNDGIVHCEDYDEELWEDVGVVDYIERKLGSPDESTPEEREEALREVLADTDIHEGDGDLSDFLFHVARTKHGRIYIRVIRTLLLNRAKKAVNKIYHVDPQSWFFNRLFVTYVYKDTPSMSMTTCVSATELETEEKTTGASNYVDSEDTSGNAETVSLELFDDLKNCPSRIPFQPEAYGLPSDFRLTKYGDVRFRGTKPSRETLESCLAIFQEDIKNSVKFHSEGFRCSQEMEKENVINETRMILGEETLCTRLEGFDLHLIETNNILTPLIEDPQSMGRLACLSVLSGIYALGIVDLATTRMSLAIPNKMEASERDIVVPRMIRGYRDAARESGANVQSARITMNPWLLVGGSASAVCARYDLVPPDRAALGDVIVVTKPLGTSVALIASQWLEQPERKNRLLLTIDEDDIKKARHRALDSMLRSNREAAVLMKKYNTHASCDISSYGILGHAQMLAKRQKNPVNFVIHNLPIIARMAAASRIIGSSGQLLGGIMPEYSGGLMLILPREQAAAYCQVLDRMENRYAWIVGLVEKGNRTARVIDRPRVIEVPAKDTDTCLW